MMESSSKKDANSRHSSDSELLNVISRLVRLVLNQEKNMKRRCSSAGIQICGKKLACQRHKNVLLGRLAGCCAGVSMDSNGDAWMLVSKSLCKTFDSRMCRHQRHLPSATNIRRPHEVQSPLKKFALQSQPVSLGKAHSAVVSYTKISL